MRLNKLIDPIVALTSNGMCRNDSDGKKDTYSVRIHDSFSRSFRLRLPLLFGGQDWPSMTASSAASDDSIHFSRFLAFGLQITAGKPGRQALTSSWVYLHNTQIHHNIHYIFRRIKKVYPFCDTQWWFWAICHLKIIQKLKFKLFVVTFDF